MLVVRSVTKTQQKRLIASSSIRAVVYFLAGASRCGTITGLGTHRPATNKHSRRMSSSLSASQQPEVAGSSSSSIKPTFSWCCTASISHNQVVLQKIAGYTDDAFHEQETAFQHIGDKILDLTCSPDWMESVEFWEQRMQDEGGAGAYDTLRCDLVLSDQTRNGGSNDNKKNRWTRWGQDFHLARLQRSFCSLLSENGDVSTVSQSAIKTALEQSHAILDTLLEEAEHANSMAKHTQYDATSDDVQIKLIRATLLWSPSQSSSSSSEIIVRGHACSSAKTIKVHQKVTPIVVTVAAMGRHRDHAVTMDQSLPTRYRDPQNKVASWTRLRKKVENPSTYKPEGVSEVLLVRPSAKGTSELEVLEGLSSNFFVIYNDGTIRTAQDGVLNGYVRHLVLDNLEACSLVLDPKPILLHEATEGMWKEAFITSSSRLIYPISKVLVHPEGNIGDFEVYWEDPILSSADSSKSTEEQPQKWQELLEEILNNHYKR